MATNVNTVDFKERERDSWAAPEKNPFINADPDARPLHGYTQSATRYTGDLFHGRS